MVLHIKSISFALLVGAAFGVPAHAFATSEQAVQNVQQSGKCTGVVTDEQGNPSSEPPFR